MEDGNKFKKLPKILEESFMKKANMKFVDLQTLSFVQ